MFAEDSVGVVTMNMIEARLAQFQPQILSIFRIVVGFLFLQHGLQKWFGFPAPNPNFANIQLVSMIGVAGSIEIVCGAFVAVGLFTRYAALLASGEMAVARRSSMAETWKFFTASRSSSSPSQAPARGASTRCCTGRPRNHSNKSP
jgi:uncharacterized membrane protein YphA (DoxX/SURF4 family)